MSYIYVIMKGDQVLGATAKKYGINSWARDKSDEDKKDVFIVRHGDEAGYYSDREPVRFTLEEYLEDPHRQHKG